MEGKDKDRCSHSLEDGDREETFAYIKEECLEAMGCRMGYVKSAITNYNKLRGLKQ